MSLTEYRRKRQFGKTREPEPGKKLPKGRRAIFVVQLHHASRRHYDFRLQIGDALKSWAVPKGPSFDPKVKRLAAEVEDHPVDYAGFEGEIPKGEYGGGHVATFDKGVWSTSADPEEQLAKGHLRFELFGDKLKGGWHLVRSHRASRQPEWLLFKDKDAYAADKEADDLLDDVTPVPGARKRAAPRAAKKKATTKSAARKRGSRRRIDWAERAAALPKARPRTLKVEPFQPQLARLGDAPPAGDDWLHEAKWDGYRLVAVVKDGVAHLWSRNALEWNAKVPDIVASLEILGVRDAVLDGELIAGSGTQADFGLLQATLSGEKNAPLSYALFDLLHLDGIDVAASPQIERKRLLESLLDNAPAHLVYSSHVRGGGAEAFAAASERGLEGIISKRADAPYRGGRGDDWRKTKRLESDEFAVVGYTAPRRSRTDFGSLLLGKPDARGRWVYAGRVGSGFSGEMLRTLGKTLQKQAQSKPTVIVPDAITDLRSAKWVEPSMVVEVFYRGMGSQGVLRQPSLKGLRTDKNAQDLFDSDKNARPAAKKKPAGRATKTKRRTAGSDADDIRLTSPTRVVYPDRGTTKRDVADYYQSVMPWFLPEIADRPVSIVRCTQGADRPCFFQKHYTAGLERVDAVRLKEEAGNQAEYLVVRDAAAVMELVQFNALEFHPWGAHADDPDRADRVVFDLDPGPDVSWQEVVDAARKVRDLLEQLELESFLRTSGGKGLHVVVPLNPGCDWTLVKPFAHGFASTMARMEPLKFVSTATKKFRKGRIFLDYLRNGRGATSVASFSLRSRPGAPIAMPLRWQELGRIKSGAAFDIDNGPKRIARWKQHPWDGIERIKQDLDKVGALLSRNAKRKP